MFEEFQEAARLEEEKSRLKESEKLIREIDFPLPWLSKIIKGHVEKFRARS